MKTSIVLLVVVLLPIFISATFVRFYSKKYKKGRRTPLTGKLLRNAGESLRNDLEVNLDKLESAIFKALLVSVPPGALLFVFGLLGDNKVLLWQLVLGVILYLYLIYWSIKSIQSLLKERYALYLGLDAEIAVGQELNQLMLSGCRVFHDFPAEGFNIDHVVVGPGGVYAVETKGRAKPDKGRGAADAKVSYDGEKLNFPDWQETKPLDQAKRQAVWLSKWLSSATGSSIITKPALALPGWFVERTSSGDVTVFNGKNSKFLARPSTPTSLNDQQIQQISHQLEQRCRDVEPTAYRTKT